VAGLDPTALQLLEGRVMHKRLGPKLNRFVYGMYYLVMPLSKLEALPMARNRFGLMSFYDKDHGPCDGSSLDEWARRILKQADLHKTADGEIVLMCLPRVLGYVFNPVSFWCCYDRQQNLRAVLCEVNNTFGERHTYICARPDRQPIESDDILEAEKVFHVSPLLHREGKYTFRFSMTERQFGAWIDYYTPAGDRQLLTSLTGTLKPLTLNACRRVFVTKPLVTFKAIALIHWQAAKLFAKGLKYVRKPLQLQDNVSRTQGRSQESSQERFDPENHT